MISEDRIWMRMSEGLTENSGPLLPLIDKVEAHFEALIGVRPLLFPSARSAISAALLLKGLNRSHTIYAPKWSSHCVWEVIGRRSNPISEWKYGLDAAIVVHKWGHVAQLPDQSRPKLLIEDSVDTLITSKKGLFPNGGIFEVQSLPKLIGSYSGGLIYCKNDSDREALKKIRDHGDPVMATAQDEQKWNVVHGESPDEWYGLEWKNFGLVSRAVLAILHQLPRYTESVSVCRTRIEKAHQLFPRKLMEGRVPTIWPVIPHAELPVLHFDQNQSVDEPLFSKVGCLPLHADFSEAEYQKAVGFLPGAWI